MFHLIDFNQRKQTFQPVETRRRHSREERPRQGRLRQQQATTRLPATRKQATDSNSTRRATGDSTATGRAGHRLVAENLVPSQEIQRGLAVTVVCRP